MCVHTHICVCMNLHACLCVYVWACSVFAFVNTYVQHTCVLSGVCARECVVCKYYAVLRVICDMCVVCLFMRVVSAYDFMCVCVHAY